WLDNDFYGAIGSLSYKSEKSDLILGAAWNTYSGDNFGKVIWAQYYGANGLDHEWYRSHGLKEDYNAFAKINRQITSRLSVYADLQFRHIDYGLNGSDDNLRDISQKHLFDFLNPKAGIYYTLPHKGSLYFSYGIAHREPNRSNYTDADPTKPGPVAERLNDLELGYKYEKKGYQWGVNLYRMNYKDQLILTGRINDVGSAIMTNVPKSYRMGVEFNGLLPLGKHFSWAHHLTISRNKIKNFVEYVDDWDNWPLQVAHDLGTTDIAFSPDVTAGSTLSWKSGERWSAAIQSLYVGRQYLDNTSSQDRSLNSYHVHHLKIDYQMPVKHLKQWNFFFSLQNFTNQKYESNGWVYSYYSGGTRQKEDGLFPQAGISYLLGMSIEF
ncbi:MAG: TonB-dependent receptor, partial [Marinilabiliales bacterium]|nr:TonB-dependent receptor [Marinilabiliales bacterium]